MFWTDGVLKITTTGDGPAEKYQREQCEGCTHCLFDDDDVHCLINPWARIKADTGPCKAFKPDLECRRTRALERIADVLEDFSAEGIIDGLKNMRARGESVKQPAGPDVAPHATTDKL